MTVFARAVMDGVLPQQAFVAADAVIMFRDWSVDGRIFLAERAGEVAACVETDSSYELETLARGQKLCARAEFAVDEHGLAIVQGVRLFNNWSGSPAAWIRGQLGEQVAESCRPWIGHVLVAAMAAGTRGSLRVPAAERPAGDGDPTIITIRGDIGSGRNTPDWIAAKLGNSERITKSVVLNLDSAGGSCADGLAIYSLFAGWPYAVYCNIKRASSMAAIIALAADVRSITPDGSMFLHAPAIGGSFDRLDERTLRQTADQLASTTAELVGIVALRTGNSAAYARRLIDRATTFNAGEALADGLVHAIRAEDVPVKPRPIRATFAPINGPYAVARASR